MVVGGDRCLACIASRSYDLESREKAVCGETIEKKTVTRNSFIDISTYCSHDINTPSLVYSPRILFVEKSLALQNCSTFYFASRLHAILKYEARNV